MIIVSFDIFNPVTPLAIQKPQKNKTKEHIKQYRENHIEHYKQYYKQYYQDNKERLREYAIEYYKTYYEQNKDKILEYRRNHYFKNKTLCGCGKEYLLSNKHHHEITRHHKTWLEEGKAL